MSAAPSLYRRHRPRTFADVVGQEHVVRTLRNAVEQGNVHHAYLFVGSRGTGKTSMAKILAACLNCERGPTVEPDGTCESCRTIASATSLDVIEMDAASNNSVEDVRNLRERVAYAPVSGRHKVYILDEAHMLTPQAWNAFLKTLEEPPPNTVFVLATTEANKILPTVADRCHRFDFTRPTVQQIATVLERVARQERIEIGPEAVALVARHATGSFRDALGTLEQLVTYSGRSIALDDVLAVLGVADADLLFEALDAIGAHDPRRALLVAARVAESGRDASAFIRDLEAHARDVMVVGTLGEVPAELAMTPDRDQRLAEQAARVPARDVTRLLELIASALEGIRNGAEARTQLELALVKAAQPRVDSSTQALLSRLERLEAALAGTAPAPAPATAPAQPPALATAPAQPPASASAAHTPPATPPAQAAPAGATGAEAGNGRPVRQAPVPEPSHRGAAAPPVSPQPAPDPSPATAAPATSAAPQPAPSAAPVGIDDVKALWTAVIAQVKAESLLFGATLAHARPFEVRGDELVVAFGTEDTLYRRKAEDQECRRLLAEAVRRLTGRPLRIVYESRDDVADPEEEEPPLSEEEIVERFKREFEAEEIVPDDEESLS